MFMLGNTYIFGIHALTWNQERTEPLLSYIRYIDSGSTTPKRQALCGIWLLIIGPIPPYNLCYYRPALI